MKLMIASDLHGSAYYCRRLLDAFRREGADRLVLLGDLLYHGPRNPLPRDYDTVAVTGMLNEAAERLLCVRGNCDSEVDQMVLRFPMLGDSAWLLADGVQIYAAHGHLPGRSPEDPPALPRGSYLLCGHIHIPVRQDLGGCVYLNPGSLSLPKKNTPHSYLILENGIFSWRDVETGEDFAPLTTYVGWND